MASVFPEMTEKMQMLYTDIIASLGTLPPEKKIYIFGDDDNVDMVWVAAVANYITLEFIKYSRDKEKLMQHTRENSQFSQMNPDTAELINLVTDSKLKLTVKEGKVDMCLAIRELRDESRAEGKLEQAAALVVERIVNS